SVAVGTGGGLAGGASLPAVGGADVERAFRLGDTLPDRVHRTWRIRDRAHRSAQADDSRPGPGNCRHRCRDYRTRSDVEPRTGVRTEVVSDSAGSDSMAMRMDRRAVRGATASSERGS